LGQVLDEAVDAGAVPPVAAAAIRLLMLTGCRKGEVLALRWADVDLDAGELRLPDAKSGPRAVQLPPPAVRLLEDLPRRAGSPWVFPGRDRTGATARAASTMPGTPCGRPRSWRMCGSMTFGTASLRARWRSARRCR